MGFRFLGSILILSLFLKSNLGQRPNTDEFFISQFFQKLGIINSSTNVCSWQVVFCDAKQENVIGVVAPNMRLTGPIPENTIGKLKKLQFLDLSSNGITDFSSDFWSLVSLKTLNLSNNKFSMDLPSNIGNFGLLEKLDLSVNNFSGDLPDAFSSLASLQVLNLSRNRFDSIIPLGITSCRSLVFLDISSNSFRASLPKGFGSAFPKLKSMNLAGNRIEGRGSDFATMVSLTFVNISMNLFKGSVVEIFQALPLEVVDLSSNQFEGHISVKSSHLIHLDLSNNQISGQIFSNLSEAHNLKHLNLAKNRFSKQNLIKIDEMHSLEYLNLSETNLIGPVSDKISKLIHLKTLDLSSNHLNGKIPVFSFKTLQNLDLSNNNLTGDIPLSLLQKLPWMERFNFSYNNLTLCHSSFLLETIESSFIGSLNSCPIAANSTLFKKKTRAHRGLKLASGLSIGLICLVAGFLVCAYNFLRKNRMLDIKHEYRKENGPNRAISGPFSIQTGSTTWVADIKVPSSVPVVIFEKPLFNFTFSDLLTATSNFDRATLLGEGRFGPIYHGFLPGGVQVAIRLLVNGSTMTDKEAVRELESLGQVKHPNLVPLTGYCLVGDQQIAIYEYMENGNLHSFLHELPPGVQTVESWSNDRWADVMSWWFRQKIAVSVARALAFLHQGCSPSMVHGAIKSSNIYLDDNLDPRLSDFGLSKMLETPLNDDMADDVYRFGVVLFELITGKRPVGDEYLDEDGSNQPDLVSWVRGLVKRDHGSRAVDPKIRGTGEMGQMVEGLKIGYLCTADVALKRPSMQQVLGLLKDIEPVT